MPQKLLPTSLVGSYAQPEWLIDRKKLASRFPPRVRATELWRVASEFLDQAQDDATLLAIHDQERAAFKTPLLKISAPLNTSVISKGIKGPDVVARDEF
jgi:methionine synthase II (cobalamin-independent)